MLTNSAQTGQMGEPLAGSIAIGTPGISASPLLAEFSSPKAGQGTELSTEVPQTEKPIEKLARLDMENSNNMPHVGMSFATVDEAWTYWKNFGGRNGYGVRKLYGKKGKDNKYCSYTFVCACEGERRKDKRDHLTKNPRAETRTGCKVLLAIKFDKNSQEYKVKRYHLDHNHTLQKPQACYLIPTQREVSEIALIDINLADLSGIRPKESHELLSRQAGGVRSIGYTKDDLSNCLRDMRKEAMEYGAAVAITKYFEKRASENSFFQHFEDITENEEIANILWMDGRMLAAYARFGEVVIFDTTFGTNNEKWALGTFVGFNNFREIVIFGAALMCDQSTESFAWVFTKFLEANGDKRPITMFTDQDHAIGKALGQVLPDTKHGLCVWHIMKNAQKKLSKYNKKKDKNDPGLMGEFCKCLFKYEVEEEFEKAFKELAEKVDEKDKRWINFIYDCKKKWAYCFIINVKRVSTIMAI